jgi:hypothetical protein
MGQTPQDGQVRRTTTSPTVNSDPRPEPIDVTTNRDVLSDSQQGCPEQLSMPLGVRPRSGATSG